MKRASEHPFPYGWPGLVCYFVLAELPRQLRTRDELRAATAEALAGREQIYAAWPGQYRTDVFVIDEPRLLAEAIGRRGGGHVMTAATRPGANTWNDLRGGITNATPRPPIIDPTILARAVAKVGPGFPAVGAVRLALAAMSA